MQFVWTDYTMLYMNIVRTPILQFNGKALAVDLFRQLRGLAYSRYIQGVQNKCVNGF